MESVAVRQRRPLGEEVFGAVGEVEDRRRGEVLGTPSGEQPQRQSPVADEDRQRGDRALRRLRADADAVPEDESPITEAPSSIPRGCAAEFEFDDRGVELAAAHARGRGTMRLKSHSRSSPTASVPASRSS